LIEIIIIKMEGSED